MRNGKQQFASLMCLRPSAASVLAEVTVNFLQKWFVSTHVKIYKATGGRLGAKLAGIEHLLLTTTGRKSGAHREQPLACFRDEEDLLIVASNGGAEHPPAWYLNLSAQPNVEVQLAGVREPRTARTAQADERARLWPDLLKQNPAFRHYEKKTSREIPVVILEKQV